MKPTLPIRKSSSMEIWFTDEKDSFDRRLFDLVVNGKDLGQVAFEDNYFSNEECEPGIDDFWNIPAKDFLKSLNMRFDISGHPSLKIVYGLCNYIFITRKDKEIKITIDFEPGLNESPYGRWDVKFFLREMKKKIAPYSIKPCSDYEKTLEISGDVFFEYSASKGTIGQMVTTASDEIKKLADETHECLLKTK